ncbi:MAG TPA: ATP-dependent DNA helicase [Dermatophilaceae bacterium]|nr:ATP-dependent DNA helicase [Dermatophilaceae bacterium]
MLTLRRAPSLGAQAPILDAAQAAAVAYRAVVHHAAGNRASAAQGYDAGVLRVLGAPGTGKTSTAVEIVVDRVRRDEVAPEQCLVLTASRTAAADLRDRITARIGGTTTEPLARTHQALGFGILRQSAALRGDPSPRLLSGPEQDLILRELLAGHASGEGKAPRWPEQVQAALATRGFRTELRDLLMRAVERGLEADDLATLGVQHDRPVWVAAAQVLAEYDEVTAFSRPGSYDPAWILGAAADLLEEDPEARERLASSLRLIVVDDAQELTPAAARLLEVIHAPHIDLVLIGDPDAAVQTFRGADPSILGADHSRFGRGPTITLATSYRQPQALREVTHRVTRRIGALGGGTHRELEHVAEGGRAEVRLLRATSQEAALIAAELRQAHLLGRMPWSDMAVIVRGQGRTSTLRRVLAAAGVPVAVPSAEVPVRDEVAVRPLLALLEVVLNVAMGQPDPIDTQTAVDAVLSPIGGADAVGLRRLRRALRRDELDSGGGRTSDELLALGLVAPNTLGMLGSEGAPARRVAKAIAAGVKAARTVNSSDGSDGSDGLDCPDGDDGRRWAPGVTAEGVLWAMWDATELGESWRRVALGGGLSGARADRNLDAVVALFDVAAKYVDRLPQMGPRGFLEHVRGQDVAGDTLVARAPSDDTVSLLTPAGAAGRQWRYVVVAGVQEGVWPDLRLRGSLLGSERLVDVVTGRGQSLRAAQAAVRYDETRLFMVAVSRASERLLVTAVRSDDEQPSAYLDIVDPPEESDDGDELRSFSEVPRPMTLAGLVAELRREVVVGQTASDRHTAARQLARLVAARVVGADPSSWWALTPLSDDRPLRAEGVTVSVSPSRIESFNECSLRWLLSACGGDGPSVGAANIGTLIHDIAAELGDVDEATMRAEVEVRWGRLGLPDGWLSRRQLSEAQAMVARLARYFDESGAGGWERVGAELEMEVQLGRALLKGRVDRLERDNDGGLRVVDLKTGSNKPSKGDLLRNAQLGAYQVAVERGAFTEHGAASAGAALLQVGKAAGVKTTLQVQGPLSTDDEPGWAQTLVTDTAEGMAGCHFVATIGQACTFCAVRSSCPVQPAGRVI